jgi:hypothetical protein
MISRWMSADFTGQPLRTVVMASIAETGVRRTGAPRTALLFTQSVMSACYPITAFLTFSRPEQGALTARDPGGAGA